MNQINHFKVIDLSNEVLKVESVKISSIGTVWMVPTPNPLWQLYEPVELFLADNSQKLSAAEPIYLPNSMKGFGRWFFVLNGDKPGVALKKIKQAYEQIEELKDPYPDVQGPFKTSAEAERFEYYLQTIEFPDKCPISVDVSIRERGGEYFCHCTYERKI